MHAAKRDRIEIPGDWQKRDRHLYKLAQKTGFQSVNRLAAHVLYEISACKTPGEFYRACAHYHEEAHRKKRRR